MTTTTSLASVVAAVAAAFITLAAPGAARAADRLARTPDTAWGLLARL